MGTCGREVYEVLVGVGVPLSVASLALLWVGAAAGQELLLKRDLAPLPSNACDARGYVYEPAAIPSAEARAGGESLASEASQAAILGQYEQARNLLREGTALDETSPSLSYSLAPGQTPEVQARLRSPGGIDFGRWRPGPPTHAGWPLTSGFFVGARMALGSSETEPARSSLILSRSRLRLDSRRLPLEASTPAGLQSMGEPCVGGRTYTGRSVTERPN